MLFYQSQGDFMLFQVIPIPTRLLGFFILTALVISCSDESPTGNSANGTQTEPTVVYRLKVDSTSTYVYKSQVFEDGILQSTDYSYYKLKENESNAMYFQGVKIPEDGAISDRTTLSENSFYKTNDTLDIDSVRIIQNESLTGISPFLLQYQSRLARLISIKPDTLLIESGDLSTQEVASFKVEYSAKSNSTLKIEEWIGASYILRRKAEETIDNVVHLSITQYIGNKSQARHYNLID